MSRLATIALALLLLGGTFVAVAGSAQAGASVDEDPGPCTADIGTDGGYVACSTPVGCVWVYYGDADVKCY